MLLATNSGINALGVSSADYLNTLIATSDGGYLLGGNSLSGISGDKSQASRGGRDYWVVKLSASGTKQWDKRFGGSADEDLRSCMQLPSGNTSCQAFLYPGPVAINHRLPKEPTTIGWSRFQAAAPSCGTNVLAAAGEDWLEATLLNPDGSMVLAGRSASGLSGDKSQASQGGRDYWVVKISSCRHQAVGQTLWRQWQ